MLTVTNLQKSFKDPDGGTIPILDVPHFHANAGEQIALIGSSGSGKTTFLHTLAGILAPDSGTIQYALSRGTDFPVGEASPIAGTSRLIDLAALSETQRDQFRGAHIGYVFQTHHLLPAFTAQENVLLGMSFSGRRADRAWGEHLLERVGLKDRLGYKPAKLSVGQQQRVAVARALANRCAVLLADEPTGALDTKNAREVLELIRSLCTEISATLLLVTHDTTLAANMPRTVRLDDINKAAALAV